MNTTELLPCPRCNGRGIDPNEPPGEDAPCWLCKGSGKSHPTPPASESSEQPKEQPVAEQVSVNVFELRDGEENDGELRSIDLQIEGRGIDILVNTGVGNQMDYVVLVDGKTQSSGNIAPQAGAEDAEAFLKSLPESAKNFGGDLHAAVVDAMNKYARHASARAVEAERQRLARLVDEHNTLYEKEGAVGLTLDEKGRLTELEAELAWIRLAGEGENA